MKIKYNEFSEPIAYVPFGKYGTELVYLHFINFEDCEDFCKLYNKENYSNYMPKCLCFPVGIPDYINWAESKKRNIFVYYNKY